MNNFTGTQWNFTEVIQKSTGGLGGSTPDFQTGGSRGSIPEPVPMEIF